MLVSCTFTGPSELSKQHEDKRKWRHLLSEPKGSSIARHKVYLVCCRASRPALQLGWLGCSGQGQTISAAAHVMHECMLAAQHSYTAYSLSAAQPARPSPSYLSRAQRRPQQH